MPLSGASTAVATFTAPAVTGDTALSFSLTVTDAQGAVDTAGVTITVAEIDSDEHGLLDEWERQYFGDLAQGPADDPDGDGGSNAEEQGAGTDPTVADSPPVAVSDLAAVRGNGAVTLTWSEVPAATSYNVYWSLSSGVSQSNGTLIADVTSPYVHSGLTNGVPVYYVVTAVNIFGESADSVEVTATPAIVREWSQIVVVDPPGYVFGRVSSLSMDADGEIDVMGSDNDTSRYEPGMGWSTPVEIADSKQSPFDPTIARGADTSVVAWQERVNNGNHEIWANVDPAGAGWQSPVKISTKGTRSYRPQSAVAPNDNAMVVWPSEQFEARRYIAGSGWESSTTVLSTTAPGNTITDWRGLTADASGNWTVMWSEQDVGLWSRRRESGAGWQTAQLIGADIYPHDLALRPDGSGVGGRYIEQANGDYIVWAYHVDAVAGTVDQRQVGPVIPGVSGEAVVLDVAVDVAASGRAAISWRQYEGYDYHSLWASIYDPGSGAWSTPQRVEASDADVIGYASTNYSYEPPVIGIDDEGNALAVWAQSDGTSIRLWTAHYYPGTGWTDPMTQDAVGAANSRPFDFASNGAGDAVVLWYRGDIGELRARHYELPGTGGQ